MAKHHITLAIAIVLAVIFYIVTIVLSALAALGKHPFLSTTANISDEFVTQITPSGWTFTIWSIIYIFMGSGVLYVFAGIFRKYTPAALAFLILIALTNYAVIFFSCHGLHNYGAWLNKYHRTDLLLHHLLIQNGIAIYATWTTIASLLNLTIVLTYDASTSHTDGATLALSVLSIVLIAWFILENSILEKYVRFIFSIYPTVIWALTGVFTKNYNTAAPTRNNIFIAALLGVACALCATRICLVIWRQMKKPLYEDVNPDKMSPMEILEKQKKIFK
ncbi:uncharacterized protein LOC120741530 [Simochromis diagramma]|uniref:uncharacterized protein LOC120741530 n=1 Tax=Simochromis diagramma TaxID=43689 RepID=UPI001A7ED970|nr:uncharacterized protein LOC120741530 [Simochromis diagramma]